LSSQVVTELLQARTQTGVEQFGDVREAG